MGQFLPRFVCFHSLEIIYRMKTVDFSGIRTRIVRVAGYQHLLVNFLMTDGKNKNGKLAMGWPAHISKFTAWQKNVFKMEHSRPLFIFVF